MKERPILFNSEMVRAILDGRKMQTRRIVKPQPSNVINDLFIWKDNAAPREELLAFCPHGKPGDLLWVRETGWERPERTPKMMREGADTWEPYYFDVDGYTDLEREQFKEWGFKRRPSIHMPRWASRITLEIVGVRVEQLQDIGEADARAEGVIIDDHHKGGYCTGEYLPPAIRAYRDLWESINGHGSWDANPWVWVIEFRRIDETGRLF